MGGTRFLLVASIAFIIAPAECGLVDPSTVWCGSTEYTFCNYDNGLVRGGAVPRKCGGQCLCEGHPSFNGNLEWTGGKCVTPNGSACGKSKDGTMEIFCEVGTECVAGRCREPNFPKLGARERCLDDIECKDGLHCRRHFVKSQPLPFFNFREKRAIGPQYCCSAETENENAYYTLEELPCNF